MPSKSVKIHLYLGIIGMVVFTVGAVFVVLSSVKSSQEIISLALVSWQHNPQSQNLTIQYPLNETLFPPDIIAPTVKWQDSTQQSDAWVVCVQLSGQKEPFCELVAASQWRPRAELWQTIKNSSQKEPAVITVLGIRKKHPEKILSASSTSICTSTDPVDAPIFFREMNPSFIYTLQHLDTVRWKLGYVSNESPQVVLENLPLCANCHTISSDGKNFGMLVDYGGGAERSYVIAPIQKEIDLSPEKIITWNDYKPNDGIHTNSFMTDISPDGRYAVTTVKDKTVSSPVESDFPSLIFFPYQGILAVYDRKTNVMASIPGADDPQYVHANPTWSPDGKYIYFIRSNALNLPSHRLGRTSVSQFPEAVTPFIERKRMIQYDIYRVPFNNGKGGVAEPIAGASQNGMSNFFPVFSPDGKWMIFTMAQSFLVAQSDSQLYIMPSEGGTPRKMTCNTPRMNSYHSFSPNGRWLVFSSKVNSKYTQLLLTHIDEQGNDTPPVQLTHFTVPNMAANLPAFVNMKDKDFPYFHISEKFLDDTQYVRMGINVVYVDALTQHIASNIIKRLDIRRGIQTLFPPNVQPQYSDLEKSVIFFQKALEFNSSNQQAARRLFELHQYLQQRSRVEPAFAPLVQKIEDVQKLVGVNFLSAYTDL